MKSLPSFVLITLGLVLFSGCLGGKSDKAPETSAPNLTQEQLLQNEKDKMFSEMNSIMDSFLTSDSHPGIEIDSTVMDIQLMAIVLGDKSLPVLDKAINNINIPLPIKLEAISALGRLGDKESSFRLIQLLETCNRDLATCPDVPETYEIKAHKSLDALEAIYNNNQDLKLDLLKMLSNIAIDGEHQLPSLRVMVLDKLAKIPTPENLQMMKKISADLFEDNEVRIAAYAGLAKIESTSPEGLERIRKMIESRLEDLKNIDHVKVALALILGTNDHHYFKTVKNLFANLDQHPNLASSSEILDLGKKVIDSIGLLAGEPSINNSQFERKINWFDEITIGPSEIEKFQFATSAERRNEIERINPLLRIKKHDQYKIVFSQGKIISIYSGNPLLIDFPNDDIGQELNNLKTNHISHCSLSVFLPPIIGENDEIKLKWPKSFHEGGSFKSSSTGFYDSIKITGMDEIIMDNRVLSYETSYYSDDNFESFTKSSNIRSISCINYEPINQYFKNKNEKDRNIANVMNKLFNFNRTLANSLGFGRIMIYDEEKL